MEKIKAMRDEIRVAQNEYASEYISVYVGDVWAGIWLSAIAKAAGWRGHIIKAKYGKEAFLSMLENAEVEIEEFDEGRFWVSDVVLDTNILKEMLAE